MKKQNIIIIVVAAIILTMAVGYAIFAKTLDIIGTATAKGNLDVEFTSIGEITSKGYTKQVTNPVHELAEISSKKDALTITVNKLDYPGAYVEIPVTVTNKGSIPAKLININQEGLKSDDGPLKVSYKGLAASEIPINQNETQTMIVRIEWLDKGTEEDSDIEIKDAKFTITLEYEQVTN